jgi:hypothetical protein
VGTHGEWHLYERKPNGAWRNFKLVCVTETEHKANYWIGADHNGPARTRDLRALKEFRPELHAWLVETIAQLNAKAA